MADYNDTFNEFITGADFADDDEFLVATVWSDAAQESDDLVDVWVFTEIADDAGEPVIQAVAWVDAISDALTDTFADVIVWSDGQIIYTETDDFADALVFTDATMDVVGDAFSDAWSWAGVLEDVSAAAIDTFTDDLVWSDALAEILAYDEAYTDAWIWTDPIDDLVAADYACWVMGETGAFTQYDNFNFDSYASLPDGTSLAATDTGLYALEGADDNGTGIAASITYGLSDFATSDMKRMVRLLLGLAAPADALVIKQRLEADGVVDEHWVQPSGGGTPTAPKNKVYRLYQGIKGRHCGFIIANKAGADFDITETHIHLSNVDSQR